MKTTREYALLFRRLREAGTPIPTNDIALNRQEVYSTYMESTYSIHLKISKVENGQYLAESDDIPGLVAQGRTIPETVEIAQDVAKKLIESYMEHDDALPPSLKPLSEQAELDITVGA